MRNWAGNISYGSDAIAEVATVDALREYVRAQPRVKALGTRHCFNRIADSRHGFVGVQALRHIAMDAAARRVRVGAGITYGALAPVLEAHGFALHNMASLPHISVAGSIGTATH